jgi:hypothetical protein
MNANSINKEVDSVKDILEASVVDARFLVSEEIFEKIKVEFSDSVETMEKSITSWLTDKENFHKYIFIQGKAGMGKSTWFHYYTKKTELANIQFVTINMNEECTGIETDALLRDILLPKLVADVGKQLFDCKEEIKKIVNKGYNSLFKCFVNDGYIKEKTEQLIGFLDRFYLNEKLEDDEKLEDIVTNAYRDIIYRQETEHSIPYLYKKQDIINIYLILKYIALMKSGKKIVFCLDNLDSFKQTFLGLEFLQGIIDIDTYMGELFEKVFGFKINKNIHYIMCLREINFNLIKIIGIETPDRINNNMKETTFDNKNKASDIVQKRLDFADNHNIGKKEKRELLKSLVKLSLKDTFNKMLPNLFNQNYRGILFAMNNFANSYESYTIEHKWITDIENTDFHGSMVAIRGILLSSVLQLFHDDSGKKNIWSKLLEPQLRNIREPHCDQTRMIMAIISNLCNENNSNVLKLSSICKEVAKYPYILKEKFKGFIEKFYEYDNDNSLLIIGEEIDEFKKRTLESEIVDDYHKAEINNILNYIDRYDPNNIKNDYKVSVSYAILSCIEHIYIHYEFYNYCKHIRKAIIPLFTAVPQISQSKLFETQIKNVFDFTEIKLGNMRDFFCNTICGNKQCAEDFKNRDKKDFKNCNKEAVLKFKKSKIVFNRTLHATRIINNHITYIDVFREFVLNYKFEETKSKRLLDFHEKTQNFLIDYIEKYVSLFYDYSHDSIIDSDIHANNFKQITNNIDKARNELKNYIKDKKIFVKIRLDNSYSNRN